MSKFAGLDAPTKTAVLITFASEGPRGTNRLTFRKKATTPVVTAPAVSREVLKPGQLSLKASEQELKSASVEQVKEWLSRKRTATNQQYIRPRRGVLRNNYMIVKISPTVTLLQKNNPHFIQILRDSEKWLNSGQPQVAEFIRNLSLHEAAHAYFARKAGATNIKFYGPTMYWDSRPQYDCPAISRSSVSWTEPEKFDVIAAKANLAGFVCRREMTNSPNDAIAIEMDLESCRKRFEKHVGGDDEAFKLFVVEAERLLLEDLQSPQVREEIWAEAKRFENEVFPVRS